MKRFNLGNERWYAIELSFETVRLPESEDAPPRGIDLTREEVIGNGKGPIR